MTAEVRTGRWQDVLVGGYDADRAVVITDPPYGLMAEGGLGLRAPGGHSGCTGRTRQAIAKGYDDEISWADHVASVLELLPARRHVIRGPATMHIRRDHPAPRRLFVEVNRSNGKGSRPGIPAYQWQGWAVYGRLLLAHHRRPLAGDALEIRRDSGPEGDHRATTPLAAALWIAETWADPGDVVVDPFAGLGTIGVAARRLGLDYIGAELDPTFAARAREIIGVEQLGLDLGGAV